MPPYRRRRVKNSVHMNLLADASIPAPSTRPRGSTARRRGGRSAHHPANTRAHRGLGDVLTTMATSSSRRADVGPGGPMQRRQRPLLNVQRLQVVETSARPRPRLQLFLLIFGVRPAAPVTTMPYARDARYGGLPRNGLLLGTAMVTVSPLAGWSRSRDVARERLFPHRCCRPGDVANTGTLFARGGHGASVVTRRLTTAVTLGRCSSTSRTDYAVPSYASPRDQAVQVRSVRS